MWSSKYSCSLDYLLRISSGIFWGWVLSHISNPEKMWRAVWFCEDDFLSYWILVPKTDEYRKLQPNGLSLGYSLSELKEENPTVPSSLQRYFSPYFFIVDFELLLQPVLPHQTFSALSESPPKRDSGNAISTTLLTDLYFYIKVIQSFHPAPMGKPDG